MSGKANSGTGKKSTGKKAFVPAYGKLPKDKKVIVIRDGGKACLVNVKKLIEYTKSGVLQKLSDEEVKILEKACGTRKKVQQEKIADADKKLSDAAVKKADLLKKIKELEAAAAAANPSSGTSSS